VFLLAHAGIALAAAAVANGVYGGRSSHDPAKEGAAAAGKAAPWRFAEEWVTSLGRRIDLRVFLAGALVSDIIDKPLGRIFYGTFGCRAFGHSLLFLLIVVLAGIGLYLRRRQPELLVLGLGILTHLTLDGMWLDLHTLLWPVLGLSFPTVAVGDWEQAMVDQLFASPGVYVPEAAGAAVLAYFTWLLARSGRLLSFVRYGRT
jgi:inner membrane protein